MADANMANFLATDKVPDTLFGIPVVSNEEDYTEDDLAFFKAHPEAGGYYDMGDEDGEEQGAVNSGPSDVSPLMKKIEATKGTEADIVATLYGETEKEGVARVKRAVLARIAKVSDKKERKRLVAEFEAGNLDLESIGIPEPGKNLDPSTVRQSRKLAKQGPHRGEFRIVGNATSTPGSHASEVERINRVTDLNFSTEESAEWDAQNRSAAYPGASTIVIHRPDHISEEVLHPMTTSATAGASADSAFGAAKAAMPWINDNAAYYVYGNRDERLDAMQRLKIALATAYPTSDLGNPAQRATAIKYMKSSGAKDVDDGVKAMLNEYERLERLRMRKVPMRETEKAAWDDLSSSDVWNMLTKAQGSRARVVV